MVGWTEFSAALIEHCPICGEEEITTRVFVIEPSTGNRIESKKNSLWSIVLSIGGVALGIGLCYWVIIVISTALQSDSCSLELITLVCEDYTGGLKLEITVNLLFAVLAALGGLSFVSASVKEFLLNMWFMRKPKVYENTCLSCNHTWTEEIE